MKHTSSTTIEQRQTRTRVNFRKLLNPRSIAFIGGQGNAFAIDYCREFGFRGDMWAVNPNRPNIGGLECFPRLADLPTVPDTAWIAVSAARTIELVQELRDMGVPSAICYTAGFGETGEEKLDQQLAEAAGDMALLGPNCMGLINFLDRIAITATSHGFHRVDRGIACIAQSGTIVANMVTSDRSLPISHLISMGNQTVVDLADGINAVVDDPRVDVIMLYIEGLKDAQAFSDTIRHAHHKDKPVVCLKGGISAAGQAIALSHTGSLAGTPELYQAFFDRLGIITVDSFPQLLEMSKLLALAGVPNGNRLMVETCSGTDSGYCADMAERYGVELPQPGPAVVADLEKVLPDIATPSNPLDVTMKQWGDREAQANSLKTLLKDPADAVGLVINLPVRGEVATYLPALEAMYDVRESTDLPCYVITNLPEGIPHRERERLIANGIIPLQGLEDAFACIGRAAQYAKQRSRMRAEGGPESRLCGTASLQPGLMLDEVASKQALLSHGVEIPPFKLVYTPEEACAAAHVLGFPVVVKGCSSSMAHKTELGAVAVNLVDETSLRQAATYIAGLDEVNRLLIETMITDGIGELIVGVKRDPTLGLALVIGTGGIFTELIGDSVHLILPTNAHEIRRAIKSLKIYPLLSGFRGRRRGDVDALIRCIQSITEYAMVHASQLLELDVNPVIVRPMGEGAVAVDALVRLGLEGGTC